MSAGSSSATPAPASSERRAWTRALVLVSHSAKASEPGPPAWRMRPGPATSVNTLAIPGSTRSWPTMAATSPGASTPFWVVTTAVLGPSSGPRRAATSGSCQVLTARIT
jgi:hypothetical protein